MAASCDVLGWTDSPITGADGNREFLVHARVTGGAHVTAVALVAHHERATAAVHALRAADWCATHGVDFWMPIGGRRRRSTSTRTRANDPSPRPTSC